MALDTIAKRNSLLGLGLLDGVFTASDRQAMLGRMKGLRVYGGIAFGTSVVTGAIVRIGVATARAPAIGVSSARVPAIGVSTARVPSISVTDSGG